MAASSGGLLVVGVNHRSSSLALRDALFVDDLAAPAFLDTLRMAGLTQAMILSTCDRVEVVAVHPEPAKAEAVIAATFAERARINPAGLAAQLYKLAGRDALRHCFAVAASLDSLIIGEPQVLGQVKAAHKLAREAGMVGPELDQALQAAFGAAKRVRTETAIAERPVSIAAAAVQTARELHGDLAQCAGLLVGAGDMGELIAETFLAAGLGRLVVTAPRFSRAEALAEQFDCHAAPFEDLTANLAAADIVVASVGGRTVVIGADHVRAALKKRRRKPIFLIDAAIPGDIEPAVSRLDEAFLYDLSDLEKQALEGRATREAASKEAWRIVEGEIETFFAGRAARAAVPAIIALREKFDAARAAALSEAGDDADKATRLMLARLLHDPQEQMKALAASGADWQQAERLLRLLYRLD
jgi:glutamyl-tRNA reductase